MKGVLAGLMSGVVEYRDYLRWVKFVGIAHGVHLLCFVWSVLFREKEMELCCVFGRYMFKRDGFW